MARIVLAVGTSHGPQLSVPPEQWHLRAKADRENPAHWFRGKRYSFADLVELRGDDGFERRISADAMQAHFGRCKAALAALAAVYAEVKPDIAVIFGNDQFEVFAKENIPALAVYAGETIDNIPKSPEMLAKLPIGIAPAEISYCPPEGGKYSGCPDLAAHLIDGLMEQGFDVAQSTALPVGPMGTNSIPHAYGFVYRSIMKDRVIPNVPVFINTHYPPNRPRANRCIAFGRGVAQAIQSWPEDRTIALIASGGFTHYVIDETFDRMVLDAMRSGDDERLCQVDETMFASGGTAEIKNWLPVYGAMAHLGMPMTLVDYVPCYRSSAGTGNGMAFAYWRS